VGTATRPETWRREPSPRARVTAGSDRWLFAAAVVAPILTSLVLISWRGRLDTADNALFLVVVIVAVASTGHRVAALVSAVCAALSFDYFLTRPYYSFRITGHQDLITELLLLVVGLAVGELAARGRSHRRRAVEGWETVALLHSVTELVATGRAPQEVVNSASADLQRLLSLRHCSFTRQDPGNLSARVTPEGAVVVAGQTWGTHDLGLPSSGVDLPVRAQGWVLGHFILSPTPGQPVEGQQLMTAVAVADLVGAVLLADDPDPGSGGRGEPSAIDDGRSRTHQD